MMKHHHEAITMLRNRYPMTHSDKEKTHLTWAQNEALWHEVRCGSDATRQQLCLEARFENLGMGVAPKVMDDGWMVYFKKNPTKLDDAWGNGARF